MVLLSLPSPKQSRVQHPIPLDKLGETLSQLEHPELVKFAAHVKKMSKTYSIPKISHYLSSNGKKWPLLFWYLPYSIHRDLYLQNSFGTSYYSQEVVEQILKLTNISLLSSFVNNERESESINHQYRLMTSLSNSYNSRFTFDLERFLVRFEQFKTFFPGSDWTELILGTDLVLFLASDQELSDELEYNLKFKIYSKKVKRMIGHHPIYFDKERSYQSQYNSTQQITLDHYGHLIESSVSVLLNKFEDIIYDASHKKNYEILTLNETFQSEKFFQQDSFPKFVFDPTTLDENQIRRLCHSYQSRVLKPLERKLVNHLNEIHLELSNSKHPKCYICCQHFNPYLSPTRYVHHCLECGLIENGKRVEKADLSSLKVYISGCRIKIGYSTTLRFLRLGSKVIGSTRFPKLAWLNFQKEPDYEEWKDRLVIYETDFKHLDTVSKLIKYLQAEKINVLINNACQTIRPSQTYLKTLGEAESKLELEYTSEAKEDQDLALNLTESEITPLVLSGSEIVPFGDISSLALNRYHDIDDLQGKNSSWFKEIDQIDPSEIVEVMAINQLVPTLLINQLRPTMSTPGFIINVTAIEGQFNTSAKDAFHPHTNMAKAAVNMMIRTLAEEKNPKILPYAIDPGFVSGVRTRTLKTGITPIQADDGASRIIDPVMAWFKGHKLIPGKYRHYKLEDW